MTNIELGHSACQWAMQSHEIKKLKIKKTIREKKIAES